MSALLIALAMAWPAGLTAVVLALRGRSPAAAAYADRIFPAT